MKKYNKYIAELIGTFALTLAVSLSLVANPSFTPFIAALTLGLFVYFLGGVSGAHFNPAITLAAWSIKKISLKESLAYISAQFAGAGVGYILGKFIWDLMAPGPFDKISPLQQNVATTLPIGFGELLGAAFFAFGVASVIFGKTPKDASGAVIGGSLLLGILISSTLSNGILNPAVAFGIGSFNLAYLLGPIVGAIIGMRAYRAISE